MNKNKIENEKNQNKLTRLKKTINNKNSQIKSLTPMASPTNKK
jgi:hypothetical protein